MRIRKIFLLDFTTILLLSIVIISATSCGKREVNTEAIKVKQTEIVTENPVKQSETAASPIESINETTHTQYSEEFKASMTDFSLNLFKKLCEGNENNNLLAAPISVELCLGMVANGAEGKTKEEMEEVFVMDIETLNSALYTFKNSLYSSKESKLYIANSVWINEKNNQEINESF